MCVTERPVACNGYGAVCVTRGESSFRIISHQTLTGLSDVSMVEFRRYDLHHSCHTCLHGYLLAISVDAMDVVSSSLLFPRDGISPLHIR